MYFHSIYERKREKGPWGIDRRFFLHFGNRARISLELKAPTYRAQFGISFEVNHGDSSNEWQFHLALPFLFSFYFSWPMWQLPIGHMSSHYPDLFIPEFRQFKFYSFGWAWWLQLWGGDDYYRSDPWWKKTHALHWPDLLFGENTHILMQSESTNVLIPMPEGNYLARLTKERRTWKRPRWPFPTVHDYYNVEIPGGIPFAGKGENSYDCGDDGLWGMGGPDKGGIPETIGHVVASVLRSRARYGEASTTRGKARLHLNEEAWRKEQENEEAEK